MRAASTAGDLDRRLRPFDTPRSGTTASAPSGTTPPVAIPIASPGASGLGAGRPAAIRATTGNRPGVSAARTAKPSIAELGNGGRSTVARAASASTRPAASASGTGSDGSGVARSRIRRARFLDRQQARHGERILGRRDLGRRARSTTRSAASRCCTRSSRPRSTRSANEWEAVYVDDGSTDGSFAALTRLHARADNVQVVRLRRNFGKAAALAAGFAQAARRRRRDDRRRPPGRSRRDPAPARQARRGLRPRLRLEDAAPRPAAAAHPVEDLQPRRRLDVRRSACTT